MVTCQNNRWVFVTQKQNPRIMLAIDYSWPRAGIRCRHQVFRYAWTTLLLQLCRGVGSSEAQENKPFSVNPDWTLGRKEYEYANLLLWCSWDKHLPTYFTIIAGKHKYRSSCYLIGYWNIGNYFQKEHILAFSLFEQYTSIWHWH